jgi:hypothetical protein
MSAIDLDKWWELRNKSVEIVISEYASKMELTTLGIFKKFESYTNIILPNQYKEFCVVFGAGTFGINRFNIWCLPNTNIVSSNNTWNLEQILNDHQNIASNLKQGCKWTSTINKVLDSAIIFGKGDNLGTYFLFDMNSYSADDLSCDIYGFDCDSINLNSQESPGVSYFLGRSFFDFIKNICIGDYAQLHYPELLSRIEIDEDDEPKPDYWNRKTFVVYGGFDGLEEN